MNQFEARVCGIGWRRDARQTMNRPGKSQGVNLVCRASLAIDPELCVHFRPYSVHAEDASDLVPLCSSIGCPR